LKDVDVMQEPDILQFLSERAQEEPEYRLWMLKIVDKATEGGSVMGQAGRNAMRVLKAGIPFEKKDFKAARES